MKVPKYFFGIFLLTYCGCAGVPANRGVDPRVVFKKICSLGRDIKTQKGSVWMQVRSPETQGQFPASVQADDPSRLQMEVTNLFGGVEALIKVDGNQYQVDVPKQKNKNQTGAYSWGGIPLEWATELFLGRIPCPRKRAAEEVSTQLMDSGELRVEDLTGGEQNLKEIYSYQFRNWAGSFWPQRLHWERASKIPIYIDFKFDQPDSVTGVPTRWEARSAWGEVKVRWRERNWTPRANPLK